MLDIQTKQSGMIHCILIAMVLKQEQFDVRSILLKISLVINASEDCIMLPYCRLENSNAAAYKR